VVAKQRLARADLQRKQSDYVIFEFADRTRVKLPMRGATYSS
jgi:hypothetical protein